MRPSTLWTNAQKPWTCKGQQHSLKRSDDEKFKNKIQEYWRVHRGNSYLESHLITPIWHTSITNVMYKQKQNQWNHPTLMWCCLYLAECEWQHSDIANLRPKQTQNNNLLSDYIQEKIHTNYNLPIQIIIISIDGITTPGFILAEAMVDRFIVFENDPLISWHIGTFHNRSAQAAILTHIKN